MQFRSPKRERRNDGISVGRFGFVLYAGKRQGCADKGGREVGMEYSVLMSVYAKEKPGHLDAAIQSMLDQTVRTNNFVIVCDGPLTDGLDEVLQKHEAMNPSIMQLVRLPQNVGTGSALNIGISHCFNELIAKMDSDDISVPDRCERQLKEFAEDEKLTVIGGNILEFTEDPQKPISRRIVPYDNDGIRKYAKRRQPFNNVTVMYRKSAVQNVGGYKAMTRGEDYDLYVRILLKNYYCKNINDDLVFVRIRDRKADGRTSFATYQGFIKTRWYALQAGYVNLWDVIVACGAQTAVFLAPPFLQRFIYRKILHKPVENKEDKGKENTKGKEIDNVHEGISMGKIHSQSIT